ncbi:uncharacterized protein LOC130781227 [Actinidia eriantha]|nr:uncharacterized protein LOC130781227 [Actinidia eriantha]
MLRGAPNHKQARDVYRQSYLSAYIDGRARTCIYIGTGNFRKINSELGESVGFLCFAGKVDNSPALPFSSRFRPPDLISLVKMTTSRRLADRKVERFDKNITKRGAVPETTTKKGNNYPVGPVLLGFFVFVVIGSSLFQIIRTATSGGMA